MGASEIKAGEAYVEIGGRDAKLSAALNEAGSKVAAFGAKFAVLGALMSAPILEATRVYAEFGKTVGKLQAKTGLDANFLTGMQYAATLTGVSSNAISGAMKNMQKAVSGASKEAAAALQKLGLSQADLKSTDAEGRFLTLAEAISGIADPGERAATAMQLFGRAGMEMLPIIENGADEIQRLVHENELLGGSFSGETLARAKGMDEAFERMARSAYNLKIAIGDALYPVVKPIVDRIVDMTVAASTWIKQNPDLVQSYAKMAAQIVVTGAALTALGVGLMAVTSPAFLTVGALMLIGGAVLAVTDSLGLTKTGFGDLFKSIRVDGVGMGTWLTNVFLGISVAWTAMANGMQQVWSFLMKGVMSGLNEIKINALKQELLEAKAQEQKELGEKYDEFKKTHPNAPRYGSYTGIESNRDKQIWAMQKEEYMRTYNGDDGQPQQFTPGQTRVMNIENKMAEIDLGTNDDNADREKTIRDLSYATDKAMEAARNKMTANFLADDTGDGRTGVDTEKAKASIKAIIDNGFSSVSDLFAKILASVPKIKFEDQAPKSDAIPGPDRGSGGEVKVGAAGSFSSFVGGNLASSGIFNQQLSESKKHTEQLGQIARNTANGSGAAYAGA